MATERQGGIAEDPREQLVTLFIKTSETLPQNLVGVASVMNLRAMQLMDEGHMTWEEFLESKLEGDGLDRAVARTVDLHSEVGGGSVDPEKLGMILPHVYEFTVANLVTSVGELAKGDAGETLEGLGKVTPDASEAAKRYLFEGDQAKAHRQQVIGLLRANTQVLTALDGPAPMIATNFRNALLGQSSEQFPNASAEKTADKKRRLAGHFRPILTESALPMGEQHGLSPKQVTTFVHNITRP